MITVTKIIISVPNWSIKDNASYTVTLSPPYGVTNLSGVSANIITKRSGCNKMFVVSFLFTRQQGLHRIARHQHSRSQILCPALFLRTMAASADARHKQHCRRQLLAENLRIVPSAARKMHMREASSSTACRKKLLDMRIHHYRLCV